MLSRNTYKNQLKVSIAVFEGDEYNYVLIMTLE